jgi:adenylate cyclase
MDITRLVKLFHSLQAVLDEHRNDTLDQASYSRLRAEVNRLFEGTLANYSLVPKMKDVTILMSDIRGFTSISEHYSPIKIIEALNTYFEIMVPIIARHGGEVDKYMGDSIMALFYIEGSDSNSPLEAVTCAVEMQQAMEKVNAILQERGMEKLYMGIGINTGRVVCSAMGTDIHREYSVIGDQVNLTARIEAFTLRGQILISEHTCDLVRDYIETGDTNEVAVKGKNKDIVIHELLAVTHPARLEVPERDGRRSPRVAVDIPSNFQVLEGKKIRPDFLSTRILDISYGGVSMLSQVPLSKMSDIRLMLNFDFSDKDDNQIYAKVLRVSETDQGYQYGVEFTAVNDAMKKSIKYLVDAQV